MPRREAPSCVRRADSTPNPPSNVQWGRLLRCAGVAAGLLVALPSLNAWSKPPRTDTARQRDRARVGPVQVSVQGRRRVRGGRPDGASIHLAWAHGIDDPDKEDRETLAAFERAAFPRGTRKTIIDEPPHPWMRKLAKPSLPVRWNRRTVEYLQYFRDDPKGRRMMRAWMQRAGRYEARMRAILKEVGVPEDLVMVVLAESGFNPRVRSRVGAAGPWQFMAGTGAVYGLQRGYWVDERFDIEKSTYAAALYLKDLRVRFGSWELALAAYNAGYGAVMTAISRHNTNNYWALCEIESGLPFSTTFYTPKIVAAALVAANRKAFGVDKASIEARPAADWIEVRVPQSTALKALAKAIGSDADLIAELNADLVRGRTPPRRGAYTIRIPRDKKAAFASASDRLKKTWSAETTHVVRHGETLAAIASSHGMTERALRSLNGVSDAAEVEGGLTLVVARRGVPTAAAAPTEPPLAAVIALQPGKGQRRVFFVTTRSTTPHQIEKAFGVRWRDIVRWNDLDPHARVQRGQVLQVLVSKVFDPAKRGIVAYEQAEVEYVIRGSADHLQAQLRRRGMVRRGYKARKGDSLTRIGRKFDLTVGDLARINAFSRKYEPKIGETIVIYVDAKKTRGTIAAPAPKDLATTRPVGKKSAPTPARSSTSTQARPRSKGRAPSTARTSRVPKGSQ